MNAHDDDIDKLLAAPAPAGDPRFTFGVMASLPPRKQPPRWAKLLPAMAGIASFAAATAIAGANGFGLRLAEALVEPPAAALTGALGVAVIGTCAMFVGATR